MRRIKEKQQIRSEKRSFLSLLLSISEKYTLKKLVKMYMNEVVSKHELSVSIVSHKDERMISRFWQIFQEYFGTKLNLSTMYHPQTDKQSERMIQIIEDMLRACSLNFKKEQDDHLSLIEFVQRNSYHSSIGWYLTSHYMEERVDRLFVWDEVGEKEILG